MKLEIFSTKEAMRVYELELEDGESMLRIKFNKEELKECVDFIYEYLIARINSLMSIKLKNQKTFVVIDVLNSYGKLFVKQMPIEKSFILGKIIMFYCD